MNKQTALRLWKEFQAGAKKNSPAILTGIGIAGMIFTTITAVKATPKALQLVDEREIKDGKRLTKKEIVQTTWKCYVPSAVTGVCSVACIIGASSINAKRNAALAAAYAISMQDLSDYKKKTLEVIGEKKEAQIYDEIAKEKVKEAHLDAQPVPNVAVGKVPCYEYLTKRTFVSDMETIRSKFNDINERLREENWITVNEFLAELGLDEADESIGEPLGWDIDHGYLKPRFSSIVVNGVPYLVIGHENPPRYIRSI